MRFLCFYTSPKDSTNTFLRQYSVWELCILCVLCVYSGCTFGGDLRGEKTGGDAYFRGLRMAKMATTGSECVATAVVMKQGVFGGECLTTYDEGITHTWQEQANFQRIRAGLGYL